MLFVVPGRLAALAAESGAPLEVDGKLHFVECEDQESDGRRADAGGCEKGIAKNNRIV